MPTSAFSLDATLARLRAATADARPPAATDDAIAVAITAAASVRHRAAPPLAPATATPRRSVATSTPVPGTGAAAGAKPRAAHDPWLAWPLALAASIAVLSFITRSVPPEAIVAESVPPVADERAFLPVVSLDEIEQAGATLVVPARMPRTTLAALGLPIDPARAADAIDTELLVRGDGAVLAVRFVF